ncbi:MAG: aldo/keto reductase [Bacteroidota bacterium]
MSTQLPENSPALILGSAMWGWNVDKNVVFNLLDEWYAAGFRQVDAATNYPIDKKPAHFRLAEKMLLEWIGANGIEDLQVMMKIGSVNNLFTPENILTKSFILMMLDEYRHLFKNNLHTLMVHWDNRSDKDEINDTLEALAIAENNNLKVGLSGIKFPKIYADLNEQYQMDFSIQLKHNVIYSDYQRYAPFHGKRRFITYGINAGGLKLNKGKYSVKSTLKTRGGNIEEAPVVLKKIKKIIDDHNSANSNFLLSEFFQVGLIYAFYHPEVKSILLGASNVEQLKSNLHFYQRLIENDGFDLYAKLASQTGLNAD